MDEELQRYRADQAHAYLERVRDLGEDCAGLKLLADDAVARAGGLRGIDYSAIRVQVSPTDDGMVDAIETIRASIASYVTALAEFEGMRAEASRAIAAMGDAAERRALTMRYLLGREWTDVRDALGYRTMGGVMKLRRRALLSFYDAMPANERDELPTAY